MIDPDDLKNGQVKSGVLPKELLITGIFSTGMFDYDNNFLITSLFTMQRMYRLEEGVHGIAVRLTDPFLAEKVKRELNGSLEAPLQAHSWMDQNRPLFEAVAQERVVMSFVLFFIMIVAAFGLCSTLITTVVQKSREIGVLKALGATDFQVQSIFILHGLIVGVFGALGGVVLGLLALAYRNDFRNFLNDRLGLNVFPADVYNFPEIPAVVDGPTIVWIAGAAVGVCVIAAMIPARHAASVLPAKALRYE
jgi:lipoprotein-releasing system permease protein